MNQITNVVIVIGPPGSGKGTHCSYLAKKSKMIHISTGDLCRDVVAKGTNPELSAHVNSGGLVPDNLMIDVVTQFLKTPDAIKNGVILGRF